MYRIDDMKEHNSNILQRFLANEQGQFGLIAGITLGAMIIATGAAVDINQLHAKNQEAQNLLDSASLAAALALNSEETEEGSEIPHYKRVGEEFFKLDTRFDPAQIKYLQFELSNDGTEVTGSVTLEHSLLFGGVLGDKHKPISAKSVVAVAPPEAGNGCIIILEENSQGLLLNSGANIDAPDCEMSVHAMGNPALISNNNVNLDVKKLCVAGNQLINNGGPISNLETNCAVMEDPFNGTFPEPDLTCDFNNGNYNSANITLNPGVYCGSHNFNNSNGQVTFNPGTYVIRNGGWTVSGGNWEAEGVSFYFADQSRIQFNSGVSANITALTPLLNCILDWSAK